MNLHAPERMTVDEYLAWAASQPGRYELISGMVRQMSPETTGHAEVKGIAYRVLHRATKASGLACFVLTDGATVRINAKTAFEPDVLVYGAPKVDPEDMEVPNPVIVVEVVSPSTHKYDAGFKLAGYMTLPSIHHVLLIVANDRAIVYHRRETATTFITTTVTEGKLRLDPPGLEIPVAEFFEFD